MKKYPPTASLFGYPNIFIFYSGFLLDKDRKRVWLSRVHTRCRKTAGQRKYIDFYANSSPNDDLENELYRDSWRCSNNAIYSALLMVFRKPRNQKTHMPSKEVDALSLLMVSTKTKTRKLQSAQTQDLQHI
jgi:hypothetical protein